MKRIVVTGGSGFIGTNLIDELVKQDFLISNLDIAPPLKKEHQKYWQDINILEPDKLEKCILEFQPDALIHLAAVTDLDGKDLKYYETNVRGTQNIIDVSSKCNSLQKVIFASSMYVCEPGFIPHDYDTYAPHTLYGESKVLGEKLVKNINEVNYDIVIIRPTSIWGPWFNIPYIDFFKIVSNKNYFAFSGSCIKTYGFIGNSVFQIMQILFSNNVNRKCFYIGDEPPIPISEWANEISLEMDKGPIKKVPFFVLKLAALFGDLLKLCNVRFPLSSFRLKNMNTNNLLPLEDIYNIAGLPPYSRLQGVKATVSWMKSHSLLQR